MRSTPNIPIWFWRLSVLFRYYVAYVEESEKRYLLTYRAKVRRKILRLRSVQIGQHLCTHICSEKINKSDLFDVLVHDGRTVHLIAISIPVMKFVRSHVSEIIRRL